MYNVVMKRIEKLPSILGFVGKDSRNGTLSINEKNGIISFSFDITTPRLYRMGDGNDNSVRLFVNGEWDTFTTTSKSSTLGKEVSFSIIENNNKRSRYILSVSIEEMELPIEIDAIAEGMDLV